MNIIFIGSGNVATYLALHLFQKQHKIVQIFSPVLHNAQLLAGQVNAAATSDLKEILPGADVYVFAVKDDVLSQISLSVNLEKAVVIHCSGNSPLSRLERFSAHRGVIWPLYSVKKEKALSLESIPLIIDHTTEKAKDIVSQLSLELSGDRVLFLDSEKRKVMHLNAVLVNNFTNHLLSVAEKIAEENQLPFELLHPIIKQTFESAIQTSPQQLQTGPAIRGDFKTIKAHIELLENHEDWKVIYQAITQSILQLK